MSSGADRNLAEAKRQRSDLRQRALEQHQRAVRRWLQNNPGETLSMCRKATGAPDTVVNDVAAELGYVSRRTRFAAVA